jgi:hypothetical protein
MEICKKLQLMLSDEAEAILSYNKLKNEMPSEHTAHIELIEEYISDEYKHLSGVFNIMKEMNCPIERSEEIEAKLTETDLSDTENKEDKGS